MAFNGLNQCWVPDVPFSEKDEWRLKIAQFGDGYQQRTLDGINALNRSWSLQWADRKAGIANNILAYLAAQRATAFDFLDPTTGLTWKVFCDSWEVTWGIRRRGGIYYGTISAEFVKANGAKV